MKSVSKIVQLMLLCTTVFTGQNIITAPPRPQDESNKLEPVYKTQQEITENNKRLAEESLKKKQQQEAYLAKQKAQQAKASTLTTHTTPTNLPPKRTLLSRTGKSLTEQEKKLIKNAAMFTQKFWNRYYLALQVLEENAENFEKEDLDTMVTLLNNLETAINTLNNEKLKELYKPIKETFSTENIWNIKIVATHLNNLMTAINNFANTAYNLNDIAEYIAIESEENPLYKAYGQGEESAYNLISPLTSAWESAKQAAAATWGYAQRGTQYIKSFIGQPSKEQFNAATARLAEIKRIEKIAENQRTKTDQDLLNIYKINESQDRAMVAKWWPYLVTVAGAGAFYYMFPEFSKNVAGYGASAAGYVAKPALKAATAYGGYKLWTSEPTSKKKVKTIAKPTQTPNLKTN